ncbi:MAG: Histidine ammonia-lyase [Chlamydiae bacterium]|nr:Histidine ammonia-lyase [Chlamydiota bacterium]
MGCFLDLKYFILGLIALVSLISSSCVAQELPPLELTGEGLTIQNVVEVARKYRKVIIPPEVYNRLEKSNQLLLAAARKDIPVYGLNRGVGLNKDQTIFQGNVINPEVLHLSQQFNKRLLLSHSIGFGQELAEDAVRATIVNRINAMVKGVTGIQPAIVERMVDFLNYRIHPVMYEMGSIGEADIGILADLGTALMGEGQVLYHGKKMPAAKALKEAGLKPITPFGKDALSIISSNAYSSALGALAIFDCKALLSKFTLIYCMSLEGLNGNIAPLLKEVQDVRPYCGQQTIAMKAWKHLEGSYLLELSKDRALQDPLSFRTATQVEGALLDILGIITKQLEIELNSSDDNPAVILDATLPANAKSQQRSYYVEEKGIQGAVVPSANFEPITWLLKFETLGVALSHVSKNSARRMIILADPKFTGLSRFLSPKEGVIAYGTIQKSFVHIDSHIRFLSNPSSADFLVIAGGMEDHATNAPEVISHFRDALDYLYYLAGLELLHAAQAWDLRMKKEPNLKSGRDIQILYKDFRATVPFLDEDRNLSNDIEQAYQFLKKWDLNYRTEKKDAI